MDRTGVGAWTVIYNIFVMALTVTLTVALYGLKSFRSSEAARTWLSSNRYRFLLGGVAVVTVSVLVVVSEGFVAVFSALGARADPVPVAIGLLIGGLIIGTTSKPNTA